MKINKILKFKEGDEVIVTKQISSYFSIGKLAIVSNILQNKGKFPIEITCCINPTDIICVNDKEIVLATTLSRAIYET